MVYIQTGVWVRFENRDFISIYINKNPQDLEWNSTESVFAVELLINEGINEIK